MLVPTHDLVFIKKSKLANEVKGLIVVPDSVETQEDIGIVIKTGPGKTYSNGEIVPLSVKEGDEVLYSKHAGQTFKTGDTTFIAIREDDIYAIIKQVPYETL